MATTQSTLEVGTSATCTDVIMHDFEDMQDLDDLAAEEEEFQDSMRTEAEC